MRPIRMVGILDEPRRIMIWLIGSVGDTFLPKATVTLCCNGKQISEPREVVMLDVHMSGPSGTYNLPIAQVIYPVDSDLSDKLAGARGDITNVFTYKGKNSRPQRIDIPNDW